MIGWLSFHLNYIDGFLSLNKLNSKGLVFNFRRHRVPHGLLCGGRSAGAIVASDWSNLLSLMVGISDKLPLISKTFFAEDFKFPRFLDVQSDFRT